MATPFCSYDIWLILVERHRTPPVRPRRPGRQSHRPAHATSSPPGIHPLPQSDRSRGSGEQDRPGHSRQPRRSQAPQGAGLVDPPSTLRLPLHAHVRQRAQRRKGKLRQAHEPPLKRGVLRSIVDLQAAIHASSPRPMTHPSPSPGPLIPTKSSPPSE